MMRLIAESRCEGCLSRMVVEVHDDGRLVVAECQFQPGSAGFGYLHVEQPGQPPATREQSDRLGRYWLDNGGLASEVEWACPQPPGNVSMTEAFAKPYAESRLLWRMPTLGPSACQWAFAGMTPNEVAARTGRPTPLLNG